VTDLVRHQCDIDHERIMAKIAEMLLAAELEEDRTYGGGREYGFAMGRVEALRAVLALMEKP
jgi:hypothetical protein